MKWVATATGILFLASCGASPSNDQSNVMPIQSPDDQTGGYVVAMVAPETGTASVHATLYDASGHTQLATFSADSAGAPLSFWWTSAPGQTTRVAITGDGGAPCTACQLTTNYTQVADTFEPNDFMDAAALMPANGQMSAFLFAGRKDTTTDPASYDDFYRFTAQPGPLSINLDNIPADLAARMFLFRTDGTEVARVSNGMRGMALSITAPGLTDAAELTVRVSLWDEAPAAAGAGTDLPPSFTQPYRLTVSQSQ